MNRFLFALAAIMCAADKEDSGHAVENAQGQPMTSEPKPPVPDLKEAPDIQELAAKNSEREAKRQAAGTHEPPPLPATPGNVAGFHAANSGELKGDAAKPFLVRETDDAAKHREQEDRAFKKVDKETAPTPFLEPPVETKQEPPLPVENSLTTSK